MRFQNHCSIWLLALLCAACTPFKTIEPSAELPHVLQLNPQDAAAQSTFDHSHSPVVPLRRTADTLLIRPLVNGVDVGWFILDTGASGLTITADGARAAGLQAVAVTSVQGRLATTLFQGEHLKVGQLTLLGPRFAGLDMPWSTFFFGEKVQGICGWDIFANSIVEIDMQDHAVSVHAPGQFTINDSLWRDMKLVAGRPHVHATFQTQHGIVGEGEFLLDTGFSGNVWLFPQLARDLNMLSEARGRKRKLVMVDAAAQVRKIDLQRFEFAGRTNHEVEALISAGDPRTRQENSTLAGMIGLGSLSEARVIIDYAQQRIAILSSDS